MGGAQEEQQGSKRVWQVERAIRRLPPRAFPDLPDKGKRQLTHLGCSVPQSYTESKPHNLIRGHFATPTQTDWAVLCSRNGISSLLVLWGGAQTCSGQIWQASDLDAMETFEEGQVGYMMQIRSMPAGQILELRRKHPKLHLALPPKHDSIEIIWIGKAAAVWYCSGGKWIQLWSAD